MTSSDERSRPALVPVTLVLGGARSGKSRFAEGMVERAREPVYLATAEPLDTEMSERIRAHRERRGDRWTTIEEPLELAHALREHAGAGRAVLVDCLTLWVSNLLHTERDLDAEVELLLESLVAFEGPVVFVSNEVGLGVVPENPLARRFRDVVGVLHQRLAERAQRVYLLAAGIAITLKDEPGSFVEEDTR